LQLGQILGFKVSMGTLFLVTMPYASRSDSEDSLPK
jgi:hypothetical protein